MWVSRQLYDVKHVVIGASLWAPPGCMICAICLINQSYLQLLVNHLTLSPLVVVVVVTV